MKFKIKISRIIRVLIVCGLLLLMTNVAIENNKITGLTILKYIINQSKSLM